MSTLQLLSDHDLLHLPPIQWLVKDFLALDSKGSFWGEPGSYKSFLAFDLAATIASGLTDWHGHVVLPNRAPTHGKPLVIYIAAEGGAGLAKRRKAWGQYHPTVVNPNLKYVVQPVLIHEESDSLLALEEQLDALIAYHQEGAPIEISEECGYWCDPRDGTMLEYYPDSYAREWPLLIVIDTLAESFLGDENDTGDMNAFNRALARLRLKYNTTVLVIHHCGRDTSHERGSTAFRGGLDSSFEVSKKVVGADRVKVTLRNEKQRETSTGGVLMFEAIDVTLPNDETSKIIVPWSAVAVSTKHAALLKIINEHGPIRHKALSRQLTAIMSERTMESVLAAALETGEIIKENVFYRINPAT